MAMQCIHISLCYTFFGLRYLVSAVQYKCQLNLNKSYFSFTVNAFETQSAALNQFSVKEVVK